MGVGRATVYRHWPGPDQLLLDAMAQVDLPFFREPVSPVRPWLRRELSQPGPGCHAEACRAGNALTRCRRSAVAISVNEVSSATQIAWGVMTSLTRVLISAASSAAQDGRLRPSLACPPKRARSHAPRAGA
jgi:hypothetical protein